MHGRMPLLTIGSVRKTAETCVLGKTSAVKTIVVQAELPLYFKMENLTAEQLEQLDDETAARVQALAAVRRFEAADEAAAARRGDGAGSGAAVRDVRTLPPRPERWDCESAVSTRSTLFNHPARIGEERRRRGGGATVRAAAVAAGAVVLSAKTGLPVEEAVGRGWGVGAQGSGSEDEGSEGGEEERVNLGSARKKGESAEEKKARKAAVKEARRTARQSKKENKRAFTEASKSMHRHMASNREVNTTVVCLH